MTLDLKAIRFVPNTKISHDYNGDQVDTFSYGHLIRVGSQFVGIPAKQNRLVIIDVDSAEMGAHKQDGREWWGNFHAQNGIPYTYCVRTRNGGWHFYFRLPVGLNEDMFSPPGQLAPGVDVKYNGWVAAPPTLGYEVYWGTIADIAEAPPSLLAEFSRRKTMGSAKEFEVTNQHHALLNLHTPYSDEQIIDLRRKIEWFQTHGRLNRDEWRDGLFSLKAGLPDRPDILEELAKKWTMNAAYQTGDEFQAMDIVEKASPTGRVGPGTIYGILKGVAMREGAPLVSSVVSKQEILDKSRVRWSARNEGGVKVSANESNAGAIIGAMFTPEELYFDVRQDQYIFKGKPVSDVELANTIAPMVQSETYGLGVDKLSKATISHGLDILLQSRRLDPHVIYLKELNWDGIPRIEKFFIDYVGVEDNAYTRAVGKNFWTALVARSLKPGIQFDSMVILEGHEGIRKSSLFRAIAGEYFYAPSNSKAFKDLDELRNMHQSVLVEIPELVGINESGDRDVKNFLSKEEDTIRAPYARKSMKSKRGFIFVGTTNEKKYLSAGMGDRRFWPLKVPSSVKTIDTDRIIRDRNQLYAEAVTYFNLGMPFYEVPKDLHLEATSQRNVIDPIEATIKRLLSTSPGHETSEGIYSRLSNMGVLSGGLTYRNARRIADIMESAGFHELDGYWFRNENDLSGLF